MYIRTKIICTIGPASSSYEKIQALVDAGMNVARINMSHGSHESHLETIELLKRVREEKGAALAIMVDTKGPEVRIGALSAPLLLEKGEELFLTRTPKGEREISLEPFEAARHIPIGAELLFGDGQITCTLLERKGEVLRIKVKNSGTLTSRKGVNVPYVDLHLPAVTPQDVEDIAFGCRHGMDLLAASFIRSPDHIQTIRELLAKEGRSNVLLLAKIENALGVENFDAILEAADGIMVARGDLGVELPLTQVPKLQKMMIRKCYNAFKPVVTATQMLESMILSPRPTRAEVSDVANAIYDSTSAVMLSGETASGAYPVEATEMMKNTIIETEKDFDYKSFFNRESTTGPFHDISSSVALASIKTAYSAGAKGVIALTTGGFTARLMSRFRPEIPIIALTADPTTYHQLASCWGVRPVLQRVLTVEEGVQKALALFPKLLQAEVGDLLVVTSGTPFGVSGTTNMMVVYTLTEKDFREVS